MNSSPLALHGPQLDTLKARCRHVCVTFGDHPLPPGSDPESSRIGLETTPEHTVLYVERGATYLGDDLEVRAWLLQGQRSFPEVTEALDWLRQKLTDDLHPSPEPGAQEQHHPGRPAPARPSTVTDLTRVRRPETGPAPIRAEALRDTVTESIFGQDAAVDQIVRHVAQHAGKQHPRKPLSILLIGPTGVGKTETSLRLADALTEHSEQPWGFLRLDMAEMAERHTVSRLIGAPPGYVGYGDESLASRLAANPRQVILFDEIEKAHPAVIASLLGFLDAGRLDSVTHGAVAAQQTIALFTSNLGVASLPDPSEMTATEADKAGRGHLLRQGLSPELVGRFGRICVFTPLSGVALAPIGARAVQQVAADYGKRVDYIDPDYLSGLLDRVARSPLGVRGIEYAVEADLADAFSREHAPVVRVETAPPPRHANVLPGGLDAGARTFTSSTPDTEIA